MIPEHWSTEGVLAPSSPSTESATWLRQDPLRSSLVGEGLLWTIVDDTVLRSRGNAELQVELLHAHLWSLSSNDVAAIHSQLTRAGEALYSWDLWGAAYLLQSGLSATAFDDFCSWVISRGSVIYARVLADPEALADVPFDDEDMGIAQQFATLPALVYEARIHHRLPDPPPHTLGRPRGEPLDASEEALRARYPALTARIIGSP